MATSSAGETGKQEVSRPIDQNESAKSTLSRFTSDQTARRIATWCEAGLDATAVPFFPLLVLVPRGIVPVVSVAGLCAAGLVLSTGGLRPRPALAFAAALLGCLLVWGTASALWSVDPLRSLVIAARLAGLFAVGLTLADAADSIRAPCRLTLLLLAGLALGVAMAAADFVTQGGLGAPFTDRAYQAAWLNRASVSFAILLLPASAVLVCRGQMIFASIMATMTAAMVYALAGTAAKGALLAGLPTGLLVYLSRVRVARVAAVVSVLIIITVPLTLAKLAQLPPLAEAADAVKSSAGHRLFIWSFAGDRIAERALTGWGLDSSRAMPGGSDPIRPGQTWMPLHPHDAPLQLWLELGVPGAVLLALLVALAWFVLAHIEWPRLFAAAAGASLMAALVASFASYGIWEEWWLCTLWFSLFVIIVMARVARPVVMPAEQRSARIFAEGLGERMRMVVGLSGRASGWTAKAVADRTGCQIRDSRRAFGVDPEGHQLYTLRQSRYDALAQDISHWARAAACNGKKLSVIDVGYGVGTLLRHSESKPFFENLLISATDIKVHPWLYRKELLQEFFVGDILNGYPDIPSNSYDVVVCEQVLEHLSRIDIAMTTLVRILRPGGKLIVGVPIFLPPLHLIRRYIVPKIDKIFVPHKARGHEQVFSQRSILQKLKQCPELRLSRVRGFRVISGGLLRPLENYRWWWKLNRRIGELIPAACIEIQAIMEKMPAGSR